MKHTELIYSVVGHSHPEHLQFFMCSHERVLSTLTFTIYSCEDKTEDKEDEDKRAIKLTVLYVETFF